MKITPILGQDPPIPPAGNVPYDGSGVGSGSTDVQDALDELFTDVSGLVTRNYGGQDYVKDHGSMGATETIDLADGNYHYGTLDADCTFTFTGTGTGAAGFTLELLEDGTGGWDPTWPGSVVWPGGSAPTHDTTPGTTTIYVFVSRDAGTVWHGFQSGAGTGSGASPNLDGGLATSTYGGIAALDAGGA